MSYRIDIRPSAQRDLARLAAQVRRRIAARIDALADEPRPPGCTKLVGQQDLWRIRVGTFRVIYMIDDERLTVMIVHFAHRRDVYRGL